MANYHISSGGVVYRMGPGGPEILVMYRQASNSYHLPKGTRQVGENKKQTALREIKEETGCVVKLEKYLGRIFSEFERRGRIIPKHTHYYLARLVRGNLENHDHEHDKVFFVKLKEGTALLKKSHSKLSYEQEQKVLAWTKNVLERG